MFVMRDEHLRAFDKASGEVFEDRVVEHLRRFFPKKTDELGEQRLRQTIQQGIVSAKRYRITTERGIVKYIDLMFALRFDFDRHAETPWAAPILNDRSLTEADKIEGLYKEALASPGDQNTSSHTG